jgi:hypothetical protein
MRSFGFYQIRRYSQLTYEPLDGTEFWTSYTVAKMARIQRSLHEAQRRLELSDPLAKAQAREERDRKREEGKETYLRLRRDGYTQEEARGAAHISWLDARAIDPRRRGKNKKQISA